MRFLQAPTSILLLSVISGAVAAELGLARKVPAREIKPNPCELRETGEKGVCMFAWHCRNFQGKHLKPCFDGVFVGSCCKLPPGVTTTPSSDDSNALSEDVNHPAIDNDQSNHLVPNMGHQDDKPPTKKPSTSVPFVEVSVTSRPTQRPTATNTPVVNVYTEAPEKPKPTTQGSLVSLPIGTFAAVTSTSIVTSFPDSVTTKGPASSSTMVSLRDNTNIDLVETTPYYESDTYDNSISQKLTTIKPQTTVASTNDPLTTASSVKPPSHKPIYIRVTTRKPGSNQTPSLNKITTPKPNAQSNTTINPVTSSQTTLRPTARPSTIKPSSSTVKKPTRKPSTTTRRPPTKRPLPTKRPTTKRPTTTKRPPVRPTTTKRPPVKPTTTKRPPVKPTTKKPIIIIKPTATPQFIEATQKITTPVPVTTVKPATNATSLPSEVIIEVEGTSTQVPTTTSNETEMVNGTTVAPRPSNSTYKELCGRPIPGPQGRIVGGDNAGYAEWPWMISLRQWKKNTFLHKCGAALLNEIWAITAAHCVENVSPADLLLRLGEYDVSSDKEPETYEERRVQIVASHPKFDPRTFEYDLALLRFYEPVKFKRNIIPVCIPEDEDNFVDKVATVTGWGRLYEDGPLPHVMQEVKVPIITNKQCESMYRKAGFVEDIPDIFICAGKAEGGKDSCEGDSGGPMVLKKENRWVLAGIISWGIGCALPNQPGVYTRISKFASWIDQIIAF